MEVMGNGKREERAIMMKALHFLKMSHFFRWYGVFVLKMNKLKLGDVKCWPRIIQLVDKVGITAD
jgi:hypothetical protein